MSERPILVVDDDPDILEAVATSLELAGYPVETAVDGQDALQILERGRPSLVVTDLDMPKLDGAGLIEALHQQGFDPPILVLTGTCRTPFQVTEATGADACLLKPFDIPSFLALVKRLRVA